MLRVTSVVLVLAAAMSTLLFGVKYEVQALEQELAELNGEVLRNQEDIHVLKAEWSHLNSPERLERLAARHLLLQPVAPAQITTFAHIPRSKDSTDAKPGGGRR